MALPPQFRVQVSFDEFEVPNRRATERWLRDRADEALTLDARQLLEARADHAGLQSAVTVIRSARGNSPFGDAMAVLVDRLERAREPQPPGDPDDPVNVSLRAFAMYLTLAHQCVTPIG